MNESVPVLKVEGVSKHFRGRKTSLFGRRANDIRAVDNVTFDLMRGETLGLVGESGCGKSTLARTILRMHQPSGGRVLYGDEDVFEMSPGRLRSFRGAMQIVFQDPYASLNPRMTVGSIVMEPWKIHRGAVASDDRVERCRELLSKVGLAPDAFDRYPSQFSGGQRQRIGLARALALNPDIIVCDEPVSSLDVSVQAQVVNLLKDIQDEFGVSYLFIAHDLSVVRHISDRVAVMYLGKIVEMGVEDQIFEDPQHPYTKALLSAAPVPDPRLSGKDRILLEGDLPSPSDVVTGCTFRTRCWRATEICAIAEPLLEQRESGTWAACHFAGHMD